MDAIDEDRLKIHHENNAHSLSFMDLKEMEDKSEESP